jgi:hypothetical protein
MSNDQYINLLGKNVEAKIDNRYKGMITEVRFNLDGGVRYTVSFIRFERAFSYTCCREEFNVIENKNEDPQTKDLQWKRKIV